MYSFSTTTCYAVSLWCRQAFKGMNFWILFSLWFSLSLSNHYETVHLIKSNFQAGQKQWRSRDRLKNWTLSGSFCHSRESYTNKKLQERTFSEKQRLKEEISRHPPCFAWLWHYLHRENSLISNTLMLMRRRTRTRTERLPEPHYYCSSDIEKGFAYLSCKLFSSSSITIINTLHNANNSFGLLTFTCKRHIFLMLSWKKCTNLEHKMWYYDWLVVTWTYTEE